MASPDNTVTGFYTQSITRADGTVWSILDGQVTVDGVIDPTTANVTELAYENGLIWQKNADNLWWAKSIPSDQWTPPYGTSNDPIPGQQASANDTIVTPSYLFPLPPSAITDASGNAWSIVDGQVAVNNIPDPTTGRVIELAYVNRNHLAGEHGRPVVEQGQAVRSLEPTLWHTNKPCAGCDTNLAHRRERRRLFRGWRELDPDAGCLRRVTQRLSPAAGS